MIDGVALKNTFKNVYKSISEDMIKNAHIGLHKATLMVEKEVPKEAIKASIAYTKNTYNRYKKGKVKTQKHSDGKLYGGNSYNLNVLQKHLKVRKLKHKTTNLWLRVALSTNYSNSQSDEEYWSYIKGFFSNALGKDRKTKKGKRTGKLKKFDFMGNAYKSNSTKFNKIIEDEIRKLSK